jgi:hypothetical protein
MNLTGERSQQTQRRAGWQTELSDFSKQIASRRPRSVAMLSRSGRMAVNHHMENGRGHRTERRGKRQRTQILSVPDLHTEDFGGRRGDLGGHSISRDLGGHSISRGKWYDACVPAHKTRRVSLPRNHRMNDISADCRATAGVKGLIEGQSCGYVLLAQTVGHSTERGGTCGDTALQSGAPAGT